MQWLELHNVEYGECIVLGGAHHDILMVDCGSINQKIREGNFGFQRLCRPNFNGTLFCLLRACVFADSLSSGPSLWALSDVSETRRLFRPHSVAGFPRQIHMGGICCWILRCLSMRFCHGKAIMRKSI